VAHTLGGGVGGLHPQNLITVKSVGIGGYALRNLSAVALARTEGLAIVASDTVQANVGMPVWNRFHLIMDFSRNQISLAASPQSLVRPFPENRSGMTVVREDDAVKELVRPERKSSRSDGVP